MNEQTLAISCEGLGRTYTQRSLIGGKQETVALRELTLTVPRGTVFGLLGPNGAGKTTTIKILSTLLTPTTGTASVLGHDVERDANQVRRHIGLVLGGDRGLYGRLTGYENLRYFGALNYMHPKEGKQRSLEMLKLVGLEDRGGQLVEQYSRGMRQRLHLARGLLTKPDVVFMDEPTIGIDPVGAQELRELVPKLVAEGVTVLLTTHYMFEADQLCDTIAIINNGSLVALGTPREIKQGFSKVNVAEVVIKAPRKGLVEELGALEGVQRTTTSSDGPFQRVALYTEVGINLNGRVQDLVGQDNLEQFVTREPTLEEAYISILK